MDDVEVWNYLVAEHGEKKARDILLRRLQADG